MVLYMEQRFPNQCSSLFLLKQILWTDINWNFEGVLSWCSLHVPVDLMSQNDDGGNGGKICCTIWWRRTKACEPARSSMAPDEAVAHQSNNGVCSTPANPFAVAPHFSQPPGLKRPAQEGRPALWCMHYASFMWLTTHKDAVHVGSSTVGPMVERWTFQWQNAPANYWLQMGGSSGTLGRGASLSLKGGHSVQRPLLLQPSRSTQARQISRQCVVYVQQNWYAACFLVQLMCAKGLTGDRVYLQQHKNMRPTAMYYNERLSPPAMPVWFSVAQHMPKFCKRPNASSDDMPGARLRASSFGQFSENWPPSQLLPELALYIFLQFLAN